MIYLQEMFVLLITLSFTEKNTIQLVRVDIKTFEMNLHCYDNQLVYFNAPHFMCSRFQKRRFYAVL